MIKITLRGGDQIAARMRAFARNFPQRVGNALVQEMKIEAKECVRRCPEDTGDLRSTIKATGPDFSGKKISANVVAGGPTAPYAIYVHEDLDAHHPVGEAKFIESTLNESVPYMADRIARRIKF